MPKPYPTLKITLGFALLGGLLGGVLAPFFVWMYSGQWHSFSTRDIAFFLSFGVQLGTAPALLTGLWLTWQRVHRNGRGLLHAAVAGALISAIAAPISSPLLGFGYDLTKMLLLLMMPIGAISALILGIALLPKADKEPSYGPSYG